MHLNPIAFPPPDRAVCNERCTFLINKLFTVHACLWKLVPSALNPHWKAKWKSRNFHAQYSPGPLRLITIGGRLYAASSQQRVVCSVSCTCIPREMPTSARPRRRHVPRRLYSSMLNEWRGLVRNASDPRSDAHFGQLHELWAKTRDCYTRHSFHLTFFSFCIILVVHGDK